MKISEVAPKTQATVLPGADFVDAWRIEDLKPGTDAATLARLAFGKAPRWVVPLLALRNLLVAPFGLKTGGAAAEPRVGIFPVVSEQPNRVVLGMNDKHLDFRLVVDIEPSGRQDLSGTATTYVRTHNRLGRLYIAVVKPFHRRIVPAMLAGAQTRTR